jgi:ABC-type glutathione transport system ATPase component
VTCRPQSADSPIRSPPSRRRPRCSRNHPSAIASKHVPSSCAALDAAPHKLPRLRYRPTHTTAVDHISLSIDAGETLGLVGESGCGKSTLGRLLLRLIEASSGTVEFAGADVRHLNGRALRRFRQAAQIVFQNADSSLNPRLSVGEAIGRPVCLVKNVLTLWCPQSLL